MFSLNEAQHISNLLTLIESNITKTGEENKKKILKKLVGEGEQGFYLVKIKALGGKSLLQHIVDSGQIMMKQREELLDLLVTKIECEPDEKATEQKIIKILKSSLPSSIKLSECIKMTEEKFRWSATKAAGLIAVAVIAALFSLSLYIADVVFDVKFVQEMFEKSLKDFKEQQSNYRDEFFYGLDAGYKNYCARETILINNCSEFLENKTLIARRYREAGPRFEDPDMFRKNAIYTLVHCISPFLFIILAGLHTMRGSDVGRWKIENFVKIPLPLISRINKLVLEIEKIKLRSESSFNEDVKKADDDIVDYEDRVNLSCSIEAAAEASPQFFFQTVYSIPTVIISFVGYHGWRELVSYKMLSIAFSFTSVALSNYFIRYIDIPAYT